jgi:transposase
LYCRSPQIAALRAAAREFCRIIRERDAAAGPEWQRIAAASPLAGFAKHLCRDEAAFLAALQQPWSNGPVEGQVHRLKLIKRSMYGHASFDLQRLRVLNAASNQTTNSYTKTLDTLHQMTCGKTLGKDKVPTQ